MAKTAVYDYSTTASSNSDFDGTDSSGATGKVKDGDNYARSIASHVKGFALDLGAANTVAGTGDAITVTLASNPTALVDGMRISINAPGTNTGAATIAVTNSGATLLGTKKVRKWSGGAETALSAGDITSGHILNLVYDSARDTAAGAFMIDGVATSTIPFTAASSSGAAYLDFAEDTDNGSNRARLQGPASTADVTVTLPAEAGTIVVGSASSTDNNIPRFDGTLGKMQAGTGLAIDDTFNITMASPSGAEGTKYPAFFCRAWVNFNGTGTVAIRGSGNVSSITDNGTGLYTINFTTAMPDANYCPVLGGIGFSATDPGSTHALKINAAGAGGGAAWAAANVMTTSALQVIFGQSSGTDAGVVCVSIFR